MFAALFFSGIAFLAWPLGSGALTFAVLFLIMLFLFAFENSAGPLFFVILTSDMFPERLKNPAISMGNALSWLFNISVGYFFPILIDALGDPDGAEIAEAKEGVFLRSTGWTFMIFAFFAGIGVYYVRRKLVADGNTAQQEYESLSETL